jgi:hypothetical protein
VLSELEEVMRDGFPFTPFSSINVNIPIPLVKKMREALNNSRELFLEKT